MDFIFMLTRQDRTVEDCLEVLDEVLEAGVRHIGGKDIGVSRGVLAELMRRIRAAGATSYLEVVSTEPGGDVRAAQLAVELGVDRLLGGTDVEAVLAELAGSRVEYLPFAGRPRGHPTVLDGDAALVEAHCRRFMEAGCVGTDLLAYRATHADPLDLVRAARRGLGEGKLVCAGSVNTFARIEALAAAGCDAFTVGTAAFRGEFSPAKGSLRSQLRDIQAAALA